MKVTQDRLEVCKWLLEGKSVEGCSADIFPNRACWWVLTNADTLLFNRDVEMYYRLTPEYKYVKLTIAELVTLVLEKSQQYIYSWDDKNQRYKPETPEWISLGEYQRNPVDYFLKQEVIEDEDRTT